MRGTVLFFDIFSDRTVRLSREPVPLFKAILHGKYSCKIAFFIPETNSQMKKSLITTTTFFLKIQAQTTEQIVQNIFNKSVEKRLGRQ